MISKNMEEMINKLKENEQALNNEYELLEISKNNPLRGLHAERVLLVEKFAFMKYRANVVRKLKLKDD